MQIALLFCSTNPDRPGDLKESFDVGAVYDENFVSVITLVVILEQNKIKEQVNLALFGSLIYIITHVYRSNLTLVLLNLGCWFLSSQNVWS